MKSTIIKFCLGAIILTFAACNQQLKTAQEETPPPSNGTRTPVETPIKINLSDNVIKEEIIVSLVPTGDIDKIISDFDKYGANIIKRIAPNPPMFLIGFDTKKIAPDKMLEELNRHHDVRGAEFNKKLDNRG